jgi:F-type H+-transporting ATPase subunit gamma
MANILDIRRRIRSVKNTQQITRAMKMVAAARLRRAQDHIIRARPYADRMMTVLRGVAARIQRAEGDDAPLHPLLAVRPVKKVLLVLVTADRGLAGAFNANLIRAAQQYIASRREQGEEVLLIGAGRKGRDFFRKRPVNMVGEYVQFFGRRVEFGQAQELAQRVAELYANGEIDAVDFVYNEFKSVITQGVRVERYLPIPPVEPAKEGGQEEKSGEPAPLLEYIYQQPPEEIFRDLLPRYLEAEVYRALLESQAAEFAARMTAMDSATRNAGDLIESYTLTLNRARQARITREIIEIVSGAAATD